MEAASFLAKSIRKFDLFSRPVSLTLNNKTSFRTVTGGLLSILCLMFITFTCGWYIYDMILRSDPNFLVKELINKEIPIVQINSTNFFIGIQIQDSLNNIYNTNSYFEAGLRYYKLGKNVGINDRFDVELKLSPCTTKNMLELNYANLTFIEGNTTLFRENAVGDFLCPDLSKNQSFGGDIHDQVYFYRLFIKKCDNLTESKYSIKCASEADYSGKRFLVTVKSFNYMIDPDKFPFPVDIDFKDDNIYLDFNYQKTLKKTFSQGIFNSDDVLFGFSNPKIVAKNGIFYLPDILELDIMSIDSLKSIENDNPNLIEIPIYLTKKKIGYKRSYYKLQDLAGNLMGLLQMIVLFLRVFTSFIKRFLYKDLFFNKLMDFKFKLDNDTYKNYFNKSIGAGMGKTAVEDCPGFIELNDKIAEIRKNEAVLIDEGKANGNEKEADKSLSIGKIILINQQKPERELESNSRDNGNLRFNDNNTQIQGRQPSINEVELKIPESHKKDSVVLEDIGNLESIESDLTEQLDIAAEEKKLEILGMDNELVTKIKNRRSSAFLTQIIKFRNKKKYFIECTVSSFDIFAQNWLCCILPCFTKLHKEKSQIIDLANKYYKDKLDVLNLLKHIDQMSLLKEIVLNKNQIFMLENKDKKLVYNKFNENQDIERNLIKDNDEKIEELKVYLKNKKERMAIDTQDLLLFEHLSSEIKDKLTADVEL